jgi:hypothetical protein
LDLLWVGFLQVLDGEGDANVADTSCDLAVGLYTQYCQHSLLGQVKQDSRLTNVMKASSLSSLRARG